MCERQRQRRRQRWRRQQLPCSWFSFVNTQNHSSHTGPSIHFSVSHQFTTNSSPIAPFHSVHFHLYLFCFVWICSSFNFFYLYTNTHTRSQSVRDGHTDSQTEVLNSIENSQIRISNRFCFLCSNLIVSFCLRQKKLKKIWWKLCFVYEKEVRRDENIKMTRSRSIGIGICANTWIEIIIRILFLIAWL